MTKEERKLWYLFLRKYPVRIYRQKVLNRYIADFYCAKAKLIIEVDGSQHYKAEQEARDQERTEYMVGLGLRVIRIPNNAVNEQFSSVCAYIDNEIRQSLQQQTMQE